MSSSNGSTPHPVMATLKLYDLDLSLGTHSITARSKAAGYAASPQSNVEVCTIEESDLWVTVSGTWVFYTKPTFNIPRTLQQDVQFTAGVSANGMLINPTDNTISYVDSTGSYTSVYSEDGGWSSDVRRHITFSETQTVSRRFYEWFNANAMTQEEYQMQGTVGLAYSLKQGDDGPYYACTGIGTATSSKIVIGSHIERIPVRRVGTDAFRNNSTITSVELLNGIQIIDSNAFSGCKSLKSITLPPSIRSLASNAFASELFELDYVHISDVGAWCSADIAGERSTPMYWERYMYVSGKILTDLVIPDGVQTIKPYTFYNNMDYLESVTIPTSVKSIGDSAFDWCRSIRDVYYKGTVEQWNAIDIGARNTDITGATIHYNYTG